MRRRNTIRTHARAFYLRTSDNPSWVRNPEDEEHYVEAFNARKGVLLDRDAIRPNTAKRCLAKLSLNSLWGKLAEKGIKPRPS